MKLSRRVVSSALIICLIAAGALHARASTNPAHTSPPAAHPAAPEHETDQPPTHQPTEAKAQPHAPVSTEEAPSHAAASAAPESAEPPPGPPSQHEPAERPAPPAGHHAAAAPHDGAARGEVAAESMNSREATGLIELAKRLTSREDYNAAEVAYRQVLNRREFTTADKQEALIGIARMYRKQTSFAKAAAIYEKFLKEFPDDVRRPTLLLELGRTLRAMGAYSMAIARFYEVINSTLKLPADGFEEYQLLARTAQFEIAETHLESGNYAEAAKFFGRLRLLDLAAVDRARAHFKAGYALQLAGDLEGSIRLLREFVRNWPTDENSAEARYLLASAFWKLNRREDALAVTLELFRTEQTVAGADSKRWAYWQRRTGNQLANEFFQAGEFRSALSIYRGLAAQSVDPTWRLPALYQSALCQERLQAPADAAESYKKVCEEVPKDNPSIELAELKRMAAWRLENLQWNVDTARQINSYFSATSNSTAAPATPAPAPAQDTPSSSTPAPQPPPHDSPASAPTTPAGLR